jgi:hypothetical protein
MSLLTALSSRAWLDRLIRRGAARVPGRVTAGASVAAISIVAALVAWRTHPSVFEPVRSDFAMMVAAARAWLSGVDPYTAIGPGRAYEQYFPLIYPFTAVLASIPFAISPLPDPAFVAFGVALFASAIVLRPRYRFAWLAVLTPAFLYNVRMSQWAALITGAGLLPTWGFLLSCKPTVGAALWLAFPSRRAAIGAIAFTIVSVLLLPSWPLEWYALLPSATHIRAPITFAGGPLVLLALLRWRRPEARLLAALACIPHTTELYESLPLFLIPANLRQGALLAVLNWGVVLGRNAFPRPADYVGDMTTTGQWMVWLLYLPCLLMVLDRPNVAPGEAAVQTPDKTAGSDRASA